MPQGRKQLATTLLAATAKISDDVQKIEDCKEALRADSKESEESFTVEVEGLGVVEVKAGSEAKLKGVLPVLDAAAFLALPESRRAKLIDSKLVSMTEQWTSARKPSVTVRL